MTDEPDTSDDILAAALATGQSVIAAAKLANVSERTARRRMTDPEFRRRVDDLRAEVVSEAVGTLAGLMTKAAGKLDGLLDSADGKLVLGAAREINASAFKGWQLADLRREVDAIKAQLNGNGDTGRGAATEEAGGPPDGSHVADPRAPEGGPVERAAAGGAGARCVAGDGDPLDGAADPAPLWPTDG